MILWIFLVFGNAIDAKPKLDAKKSEPISQSFLSIKKCYKDLATDEFQHEIDLNALKDKVDQIYLTTKTDLRYRKFTFLDGEDIKRLTIRAGSRHGKAAFEYEMRLEKIDGKGTATEIEIPAQHRKNPTQSDINSYIMNAKTQLDETSFIDTKLNGMILTYRRHFKQIQDLELKDKQSQHTLTCENQKNLGVVCTCK